MSIRAEAERLYPFHRPHQELHIEFSLAFHIIVELIGVDIVNSFEFLLPESTALDRSIKKKFLGTKQLGGVGMRFEISGPGNAAAIQRILVLAYNLLRLSESPDVKNFNEIIKKLNGKLRSDDFERIIYEIQIISYLLHNNSQIEILKPFKKRKTPDIQCTFNKLDFTAEFKCNKYKDLDKITDYDSRTQRVFHRLEEGCKQIQDYGDFKGISGFVYIQYMNNIHFEDDRKQMLRDLFDIIVKYPRVDGAFITLDIYQPQKLNAKFRYTGLIKDPNKYKQDVVELVNLKRDEFKVDFEERFLMKRIMRGINTP